VEWHIEDKHREKILLLLEGLSLVILEAAKWLQGMPVERREVLGVDVNLEAYMGRIPYTVKMYCRRDGKIWMSLVNDDERALPCPVIGVKWF
jgi:hypothetical protein